ncbi:nicotinate (nicotinamide) nucleotide adenylyltransferase [Flavobacteriales bacterium]|jgi:nicotinate-nucleotide adenylyltransferase|nr:nicotinate (nicotinamide) nucleotide adenylyltransferase [Flavobacteriales bacterium]
MKVGLFFGSFNPMHIGHKVIASYLAEFTDIEKVMLVVSPQNPFKAKKTLLHQHHRLMIIKSEIENNNKLLVSDIEFSMPQPSYTIDTLVRLKEKNPDDEYVIIIGSDNLKNLHKWKNYSQIISDFKIYVYPRNGFDNYTEDENIYIIKDVPQMEVSASFIRNSIKLGKDVSYLVPDNAWKYIDEMNFYR